MFLGVAVTASRAQERGEGLRRGDQPCAFTGGTFIDEALAPTGVCPAKRYPAGLKGRFEDTFFASASSYGSLVTPRVADAPRSARPPVAIARRGTLVGVVELRI